MPGLEVWGVLHGAQKDLALLRLLLTAAFHLFPQCAPPIQPQFLFWVLPLAKLKFSHPDPSACFGVIAGSRPAPVQPQAALELSCQAPAVGARQPRGSIPLPREEEG